MADANSSGQISKPKILFAFLQFDIHGNVFFIIFKAFQLADFVEISQNLYFVHRICRNILHA
ncbi:hypothetical protein D3C80_1856050 [compost metagenome]